MPFIHTGISIKERKIFQVERLVYRFQNLKNVLLLCRDYEILNHQMLLTLVEKMNGMQRSKELSWDSDSDVDWSSWIDTDLPEEVEYFEDPNYRIPEEVGENWITNSSITTKYDLRPRPCHR